MKLKRLLLFTVILMILFTAYNLNNSRTQSLENASQNNSSEELHYDYTVKGNSSDEFSILIQGNPIDEAHRVLLANYDGSSRLLIEYSNQYKEWWQVEMEQSYNQLLFMLNEEDCHYLKQSQASWEEYMENKKDLELSFFFNQNYDTIGNLRKALSVNEEAEETKERAYSLLEYLYIITGEINLFYGK